MFHELACRCRSHGWLWKLFVEHLKCLQGENFYTNDLLVHYGGGCIKHQDLEWWSTLEEGPILSIAKEVEGSVLLIHEDQILQ